LWKKINQQKNKRLFNENLSFFFQQDDSRDVVRPHKG